MNLQKLSAVAFIAAAAISLSSCNLTADDNKRIDSAEDNLQKVALDPKILQPSVDEVITGTVEVIVDVDDSVEYEKVTLQVGAEVIQTITEAPYTFEFDTYFWSDHEKITLMAKAYMVDGNQLRSEAVSVEVDTDAQASLSILSPVLNEAFPKTGDVEVSWSSIPSAVQYEYQLNDETPVKTTETSAILSFDGTKGQSIKVRATNALEQTGIWSSEVKFSTGLFAYAYDIKKYGYSYQRNDNPVDFLIDEDDFILLANGSDQYDDGSGDSYHANIAKIGFDGTKDWHKTYSQFKNATSISKTADGYVIAGGKLNWGDSAVFEIDNAGLNTWSESFNGMVNDDNTSTREIVNSAVEVSEGVFLASHERLIYERLYNEKYDYWYNSFKEKVLSFDVIDRNASTITPNIISQPSGGEYSSISQLLVSNDTVYAAGLFKSNSGGNDGSSDNYSPINSYGSGTVLFKLAKSDGSIQTTVTGGGIANTEINDLTETTTGEIISGYYSYDRAGATVFDSNGQSNTFANALGVRYASVAADSENGGFAIAGESTSSYEGAQFLRFDTPYSSNRMTLSKYTNDLVIKAIKYDPRFGYVVMATEKGALSTSGSYTVIFNISDDNEYILPTGLIE